MITCQRPRSRPAESLLSDSDPSIPQICVVCQAITVKPVKGKRADLQKKKKGFLRRFYQPNIHHIIEWHGESL